MVAFFIGLAIVSVWMLARTYRSNSFIKVSAFERSPLNSEGGLPVSFPFPPPWPPPPPPAPPPPPGGGGGGRGPFPDGGLPGFPPPGGPLPGAPGGPLPEGFLLCSKNIASGFGFLADARSPAIVVEVAACACKV